MVKLYALRVFHTKSGLTVKSYALRVFLTALGSIDCNYEKKKKKKNILN